MMTGIPPTVPGQMDLLVPPEQRGHSEPEDYRRQKKQKDRLRVFMLGHGGHMTLSEIRSHCGGSDTGNSAALRRLRKEGYRLDTPRRKDGVWLYRLRVGPDGDWRARHKAGDATGATKSLAQRMRAAVDAELPEDEPNDVRDWVYETCARVALSPVRVAK